MRTPLFSYILVLMPELPEVETVRIQLQRKIIGKTIDSVEVFHNKSVAHDEQIEDRLRGKTFSDIDRIGKLMIFSFTDEDNLFLLAHLKMTGQFFFVGNDGEAVGGGHSVNAADRELPGTHTRVAFHFTDHTSLFFNDMRLFGYTKIANAAEVARARSGFGPEPIDTNFDCTWFTETLKKRRTPVKAALLDQSFVAGLGNIYVDEALWRARVRPTRRADKVTKVEAARLCRAAGDVMRESIAVRGTTFQHFVDTGGKNGNFTDHLKVFGQHGSTCEHCGHTIKKIRCAGRGTHYCPGCQK
jgi:formamidopyrimidine-DNA glycosylase